MNAQDLEALLQQVITALEASVPHTPSLYALEKHWEAFYSVTDTLHDLRASSLTSLLDEQSKPK